MGNWPVYGLTLALAGAVAFGITRRGTNTSARVTSPPTAPGRSEDTEALQAVGSWEFLVALDRSGAFPEDEP